MHDLEKMVNIMETEYQLYNTLLDLSQKKTHAIANGKIKDLEKLVEAEEHLVLELSRVEDERERCAAELARQLGMDSKDVTISNLISHAEGEL
ncbi:MAG: flagellar export chaperone FlgN, partial [Caldicoprobacteraceae bacterium]